MCWQLQLPSRSANLLILIAFGSGLKESRITSHSCRIPHLLESRSLQLVAVLLKAWLL